MKLEAKEMAIAHLMHWDVLNMRAGVPVFNAKVKIDGVAQDLCPYLGNHTGLTQFARVIRAHPRSTDVVVTDTMPYQHQVLDNLLRSKGYLCH